MHVTELLEQFRTGTKGTVHCRLLGVKTPEGKDLVYQREGDNYLAGVGDGVVRLMGLMDLRRRRSTFWYKFLNGRYDCIDLDISIKRLQEALNGASVSWTE